MAVISSEAVGVTGAPRISLWLADNEYRWADYNAVLSESGRPMFVYTVQAEDQSPTGLGGGKGLALNGGTIKSADGLTHADLTYGFSEIARWRVTRRAAVKVDGQSDQ